MIYVVEIACIVFLLVNAAICITFGSFKWEEWKAYREISPRYRAGFYACIGWLFGLYHLLFAILKAFYTALDALQ